MFIEFVLLPSLLLNSSKLNNFVFHFIRLKSFAQKIRVILEGKRARWRDPAIDSRAERRDESGIGGVIAERSNEAIYRRGCARVSFRECNVATAQRRNREGIVAGRHRFRGKVQGYAETLRRMQTRSENVVVISKSGEIPAKYPVFRILIAFEVVVGSGARSSRLVSFYIRDFVRFLQSFIRK